jgi:hypothetical protein
MNIKEKEMKIAQTYRADSAPQEPKSALPRLMRGLGLTLLACTLVVGMAEAQQAAQSAAPKELSALLASQAAVEALTSCEQGQRDCARPQWSHARRA